jgi:hypothetical protein
MTQENVSFPVESPCNNQCKLVDDMSFCQSCFRTIEEIYVWGQVSDDERLAILDAVAERRRKNDGSGT